MSHSLKTVGNDIVGIGADEFRDAERIARFRRSHVGNLYLAATCDGVPFIIDLLWDGKLALGELLATCRKLPAMVVAVVFDKVPCGVAQLGMVAVRALTSKPINLPQRESARNAGVPEGFDNLPVLASEGVLGHAAMRPDSEPVVKTRCGDHHVPATAVMGDLQRSHARR